MSPDLIPIGIVRMNHLQLMLRFELLGTNATEINLFDTSILIVYFV